MMHKRSVRLLLLALLWQGVADPACAQPAPARPTAQPDALAAFKGDKRAFLPDPAWSCGMPEGIPAPELGALVFEATMPLEAVHRVGRTQFGDRVVYVVKGGNMTGEKINGTVLSGGLDFELNLTNGVTEIEQILVLRLSDNRFVYVRAAGVAADRRDVRLVPMIAAPNAGEFSWLSAGKFVARRVLDEATKTLKLAVYDVGAVPLDTNQVVRIAKPPGVPAQPWDFRRAAPEEKRGEVLITENVTLAGSQSVGATKRGTWNIIPITGGTLTGRITGQVLSGGADYQNLGNPATIDARYLWQTADGEVIIVRNAGPFASLVPTFEVRLDSQYAYLNQGKYLSSGPGMGAGGVKLTFYESAK